MATSGGERLVAGRLALREFSLLEAVALPAALVLLVGLTRIPFRTRYLLNWDAGQFALGLSSFDVAHHQPHPPGYIGYVALGRLLLPIFGDPNTALVVLSIAGEAAAVLLAYAFARSLFGIFAALVTGLAMVSSPLFWYYGEVANVYALEPALVLAIAWFAWRAWQGDRGAALGTAASLALAGAVRPSTMVLLAPLTAAAVWRQRDRGQALRAATIFSLGVAAWLVPLLILSGGPFGYLQASLQLGGTVTSGTALWRAGVAGLLANAKVVAAGLLWELGAFSLPALFGLAVAPRLNIRLGLPREWRGFCWLWAAPAVATYLLVHIGQAAYVQSFAPALLLTLGPAVLATGRALQRLPWTPSIALAATLLNAGIFLLPVPSGMAMQLAAHDRRVAAVEAIIRSSPPAQTTLFTDGIAVGSYRLAQVYLPEYERVAIAFDDRGALGQVYGDVYDLTGFRHARPLPGSAVSRTYVFLDAELVSRVVADPERMTSTVLTDGSRIYTWSGPAPRVHYGQVWLGPAYHVNRGLG